MMLQRPLHYLYRSEQFTTRGRWTPLLLLTLLASSIISPSVCSAAFSKFSSRASASTSTSTSRTALWGKRQRKSNDILSVEQGLYKRGFFPIVGSDESGRGCVAGPVIAASCCILANDNYTPIEGVNDSKKLSAMERERIYDEVVSNPNVYAWAIAQQSNTDIDDSNILIATMACFKESIEQVVSESVSLLPDDSEKAYYSIVDGKKTPKLDVVKDIQVPCRPWVKGDAEVYTVALASIIAKVSRDRLAADWHALYPDYGFDVHKGYATRDHVEAIHKHGPCPIHRLSFKSLKGR